MRRITTWKMKTTSKYLIVANHLASVCCCEFQLLVSIRGRQTKDMVIVRFICGLPCYVNFPRVTKIIFHVDPADHTTQMYLHIYDRVFYNTASQQDNSLTSVKFRFHRSILPNMHVRAGD